MKSTLMTATNNSVTRIVADTYFVTTTRQTVNPINTAIVGSNRDPQNGGTGPGHYGPFGAGRRCTAEQRPEPMPKQCDDGPFGRGTGGRLRYKVKVPGRGSRTI